GIRDFHVTGVQTCALPISPAPRLDQGGESAAGERGRGPIEAAKGSASSTMAFRGRERPGRPRSSGRDALRVPLKAIVEDALPVHELAITLRQADRRLKRRSAP